MQFCESPVMSMSTESGDDSNLAFLLDYNLPGIMIHSNMVIQRHFGTTNSDHNLHELRRKLFRSACHYCKSSH